MISTTKLNAINTLLATIGDAPVNRLDDELTGEVAVASNTLNEVTRQVLTEGFPFNTEVDFTLTPDEDSYIYLPATAIRVRLAPGKYSTIDPVIRGDRLYDRKNQTYEFEDPVEVTSMVLLMDLEDIPESCRQYIMVRAARLFQDRVQGSEARHVYTQQDELQAKRIMQADLCDTSSLNMMQDASSYNILRRGN